MNILEDPKWEIKTIGCQRSMQFLVILVDSAALLC